ncbi:MAG: nickel-dependent lactate racemase, partial [Calditerrivibrio sp.]|nr:nickel-dependent lactate racemase [Calditerrivibrio sp.]
LLSIDREEDILSIEDIINTLNSSAIMMEGIEDVIENADRILLILPDITRKSGADIFLPYIVNIFEKYEKDFNIIFAIGTHRKLTKDEKISILTEDIYRRYEDKIIDHDCDNISEHFYFGKTRNNTPILINNAYTKANTIITIGAVSYHYFAGFGGGRKLIIPGIASRKTALHNHKLVLDETNRCKNPNASTANLKENPVHQDILEALMIARRGKTFFSINTILDEKNRIVDLTCGDIFMSHLEACNRLMENTTIKIDKKYKNVIVSAGGFPKDINMVQAQKSIDRIKNIVEPGGNIFFFAECIDGYGENHFQNFFDIKSSKEMFESLLLDYQINRQTAYNLRKITEDFSCYLFSSFSKEDTERMGFLKLKEIESIKEIIGNETAAFVPSSYSYYFKIDG